MAGFGYFLQGLAGGLQQAHEKKMQKEEADIRNKFLKAQVKALEMKDQYVSAMSPEDQKAFYLYGGKDPLEQLIVKMLEGKLGGGARQPVDFTGAMSTNEGSVIPNYQGEINPETGMPVEQVPAGLPEIIAKMGLSQEDLISGAIKKTLGIDPFETQLRSVKGPGGRPVTQPIRVRSGQPVGTQTEEAYKLEGEKIITPTGEEYRVAVDPYTGKMVLEELSAEEKAAGFKGKTPGFQTRPAEIEVVPIQKGGLKYDQDINKVTREPIGVPRLKEGVPQQTAIYQSNIKNVGIPAADGLIKSLFTFEGGKPQLTMNARIQGTFPDISQKLGGQIANDAMKLAFSLLRPESGALINQQELGIKISQQLPKIFTTSEYAVENLLQIGDVIDSYLQGIDPDYVPQARTIMHDRLNAAAGKKLKTPTAVGSKGKTKDPSKMSDQEILQELNR